MTQDSNTGTAGAITWLAIARVCHEAIRALRVVLGEEPLPAWDDAPDWMRDSSHESVLAYLSGQSPEELFETWRAGRAAAGWRYGPVRDEAAKTNPCMVASFGDLPGEQQAKDRLYAGIVGALAPGIRP